MPLEKVVGMPSLFLTKVIEDIVLLKEGFPSSLNSLVRVVTNERIALDFFEVQDRACTVTNTFFCTWINISGQVEKSI